MMENRPLILASSSPRRAQLLREAGYPFEQVTPPFDDSACALVLAPNELAAEFALRKAASVAQIRPAGIVLGCDTLLSIDGRAIGKPADVADARFILGLLFTRAHHAITAVSLLDAADGRKRSFIDTTQVTITAPGSSELDAYLASGQWRGKAGGYNLAELKDRWHFDIQGDPTTVVGLPMVRLEEELRRFAPDLRPHA